MSLIFFSMSRLLSLLFFMLKLIIAILTHAALFVPLSRHLTGEYI